MMSSSLIDPTWKDIYFLWSFRSCFWENITCLTYCITKCPFLTERGILSTLYRIVKMPQSKMSLSRRITSKPNSSGTSADTISQSNLIEAYNNEVPGLTKELQRAQSESHLTAIFQRYTDTLSRPYKSRGKRFKERRAREFCSSELVNLSNKRARAYRKYKAAYERQF